MNGEQKGFILSILLHCAIAGSLLLFGDSPVRPAKLMVIDLAALPAGPPLNSPSKKGITTISRQAMERLKTPPEKDRLLPRSLPSQATEQTTSLSAAPPDANVDAIYAPAPALSSSPAGATALSSGIDGTKGAPARDGKAADNGGDSPAQLRNGYLRENFAFIKDIIQKHIVYPPRARKMGWSGRVVVSFVIDEQGWTSHERIVESSGFAVLDGNVIKAIRAVNPFPRPPLKAELSIPIIYRLD